MSGEEEDQQLPEGPDMPVTTTPVTTTPVPTVPMTTVPAGAYPLRSHGHLTPGPARGSCYEYQPPHETGACTRHKKEKKGWEERLACIERAEDWLNRVTDDALMGIPGTVA
ncbi:UNVERIFIED_CONTAM: hypothetical protein K2H54_001557 [Gekko kuhli]